MGDFLRILYFLRYDEVEQKATFTPAHSKDQIANRKLLWLEHDALVEASAHGDYFNNITEKIEAVIIEELYENFHQKEDEEKGSQTTQAPSRRELPLAKMSDDFINPSVTPETHMVYALTWGLLALIGSFMTVQKFRGNPSKAMKLKKAAENASKI